MRDPTRTPVAEVMTTDIVTCGPETTVDEAAVLMKDHRVRHLPVFDHAGGLCGMISIGDINAYHVRDQQATILTLNEYIHGRV
jgi:CBS domain-containing protein